MIKGMILNVYFICNGASKGAYTKSWWIGYELPHQPVNI